LKKEFLNNQNIHWEDTFSSKPQMFGSKPSVAAIKAVEIFKQNGVKKIIELGGGQGRDTMYFAENGFEVTVVDYTSIRYPGNKRNRLVNESVPFNYTHSA